MSLNHSLDEPRRSNDIARRIVETCIFRERKLEARKKVDATEGESETEKEEHDGLHPTSSLVIVVRLPPRSHDEERTVGHICFSPSSAFVHGRDRPLLSRVAQYRRAIFKSVTLSLICISERRVPKKTPTGKKEGETSNEEPRR